MKVSRLIQWALLACVFSPAFAFTGGVTTYNKPTPTTVQRVATATAAAGPERDATYQRVMRKAQTSAAAGKAMRALLRQMTGIGTLITVVELAKDLSSIVKATPDGHVQFMKVQTQCTTDPCYAYGDGTGAYPFRDPSAACSNIADRFVRAQNGNWTASLSSTGGDGPNAACTGTRTQTLAGSEPQPWYTQPNWTTVPVDNSPANQTGTVISDAELDLKLAEWPKLPELLDEVAKKGAEIDWPGDEVEDMPQPLVLSPTTTIKPDGTKIVEQTTLTPERNADGKTIDWKRNVKTTETSPPDAAGQTTTKTTNTDSNAGPSKGDKPVEAPATDSALPEQPKLYTKKYPDGMTGVWRDQRSAMANSPLFTLPRMLMPSSVGSSGSCPVMNVNLTFSQWANFGTKDVAPPCYVWDWAKAICIVGACLLARRLIFGG